MNESKVELTDRLRREGRWGEATTFKDAAVADFRAKGMKRDEAGAAAWEAMAEAYPPRSAEDAVVDVGRVQGLGDIPEAWGELPANASLKAEIGWCQANRLLIVEESSGAMVVHVHLDRARVPAPSWAALGWLETSIRSYAKFIDVAAKVTAAQQDEQELVRRERMGIEEVHGLLAEMVEAEGE